MNFRSKKPDTSNFELQPILKIISTTLTLDSLSLLSPTSFFDFRLKVFKAVQCVRTSDPVVIFVFFQIFPRNGYFKIVCIERAAHVREQKTSAFDWQASQLSGPATKILIRLQANKFPFCFEHALPTFAASYFLLSTVFSAALESGQSLAINRNSLIVAVLIFHFQANTFDESEINKKKQSAKCTVQPRRFKGTARFIRARNGNCRCLSATINTMK